MLGPYPTRAQSCIRLRTMKRPPARRGKTVDRSASKSVPDDSHSISMEPPSGRRSGRRNGTAQARVSAKVEGEGGGIHWDRRFTHEGVHPFDEVTWETRPAAIGNEKGETVFEQKDCEIPTFWSQMATNVVVSKYFRGKLGTPGRENSVKQMSSRVADTIGKWGREGGYFATESDAQAFQDELTHLLLHQKMSFNSPVWFNIGVPGSKNQASACFINSVEDTMESILTLAKTEGMLFKYGSGTGTNLSPIRSSTESLAGGGTASGPVSFMKGFDAFAGVIKSGGTPRRAAKMVILNADHPDIEDFVTWKVTEERKAWALIESGYDSSFTGEAYASVFFQNSNNSVRVTDEFMRAVQDDRDWHLRAVTDANRILKTVKARDLMRLIAESAWQCGDPGFQYDTTINDWHTSAATGRINASNPCSEFMFLDDTSCNLASINLTRFLNEDGSMDIEAYKHAIHITITAQEILVSNASYPSEKITTNREDFRPLGLGYANLGALLMARGVPYDSPRGRDLAACLTSILTGEAYAQSSRIAREIGPFSGYAANRQPMLRVVGKHREAAYNIPTDNIEPDLVGAARHAWDEAHELGARHGYRNSQASVLAPTGTISFMLDCDTTGVEPDIALVKYKKLVGGGMLKMVNGTVPAALRRLGYGETAVADIIAYIDANDTIEGAPTLREEDVAVFDCAFTPQNGKRSITWQGHLRMMAAVQPFISGAISKTVNMPNEATVETIERAYTAGRQLGHKVVAIYRDGSKRSQPLATALAKTTGQRVQVVERPLRRRLPSERTALTHRFEVGGHEGYITVGLYEDGTPGEIFLRMAKEGSTVSGLMDSFATAVSLALQYGVPLQALVDKFSHTRFDPQGFTKNPEIPIAKSVMDYIFRWLASRFLSIEERDRLGIIRRDADGAPVEHAESSAPAAVTASASATAGAPAPSPAVQPIAMGMPGAFVNQEDAPTCSECGSLMVRNGACYKCHNCGATSGCS